jgi:hypothetical protein
LVLLGMAGSRQSCKQDSKGIGNDTISTHTLYLELYHTVFVQETTQTCAGDCICIVCLNDGAEPKKRHIGYCCHKLHAVTAIGEDAARTAHYLPGVLPGASALAADKSSTRCSHTAEAAAAATQQARDPANNNTTVSAVSAAVQAESVVNVACQHTRSVLTNSTNNKY